MAVVTNTWNDATNIRPVLFLAPTVSYAQAVVRNTRKDLDKEGIKYDSYAGVLEGDPFLSTEHLHVKFVYSDPVLWSTTLSTDIP